MLSGRSKLGLAIAEDALGLVRKTLRARLSIAILVERRHLPLGLAHTSEQVVHGARSVRSNENPVGI